MQCIRFPHIFDSHFFILIKKSKQKKSSPKKPANLHKADASRFFGGPTLRIDCAYMFQSKSSRLFVFFEDDRCIMSAKSKSIA